MPEKVQTEHYRRVGGCKGGDRAIKRGIAAPRQPEAPARGECHAEGGRLSGQHDGGKKKGSKHGVGYAQFTPLDSREKTKTRLTLARPFEWDQARQRTASIGPSALPLMNCVR